MVLKFILRNFIVAVVNGGNISLIIFSSWLSAFEETVDFCIFVLFVCIL